MTAEIVVLPGIERRDLAGKDVPAVEVLQAAINGGVTDVVVVGRDRSGGLYISGCLSDVDKAVGTLMRAVSVLSDATVVNDVVLGGPDEAG